MESFADVNGIKICYEIRGKENSFPVILVHGFSAKKEAWVAQFGPLSEKLKVIRFDNRTAGKSDRPNQPLTAEIFADDLRGLMDYLNIEKAHVIGWSLGGIIVQHFALKYPERLDRLVLIATVMGSPDEQGVELLRKTWLEELEQKKQDPEKTFWKSARLGFYIKFRKRMKANPKKKFYDLWSVEDLIKDSITDSSTPQDIINQSYAMLSTITLDNLRDIKSPTLLIAASHDRICAKSSMVEMHETIPNSILKVIDKAGHSAPVSRAPEVNKIIIEFLEKK